jgi:hypothetical protein
MMGAFRGPSDAFEPGTVIKNGRDFMLLRGSPEPDPLLLACVNLNRGVPAAIGVLFGKLFDESRL